MKRKEKFKNKNVGVALLGDPSNIKTQKGITIIALIITIVIILILSSVGIYVGMDSIKHARVLEFVSYMQVIQKRVDEVILDTDYGNLGTSVSTSGKQSEIEYVLSEAYKKGEIQFAEISDSHRYFSKDALETDLNLYNIDDNIIINFETREVVSLTGIEYNKKGYSGIYYTQYLLPTGQNLVKKSDDINRELSFETDKKIDGLQATITITGIKITNGTLSYKEQGETWNIINNYTNQGDNEQIILTKSGEYIFKLTDNNNEENYYQKDINLVLANPPILEEDLTYVKEEYDYSRWNK